MNLLPAISTGLPGGAADFLGKVARALAPSAAPPQAAASAPDTLLGTYTLTSDALRSALLSLGETVSAANLHLAEAFTHLGLPLTAAALSEARIALARAPGADESAFALAKSLSLPASPGILHALSAVTRGIPPDKALPAELMDWLSFAARADEEPDALAAQLHLMTSQRTQSVESRLAGGSPEHEIARHTRTLLLRLADGSADPQVQTGADTLAAHLEGQQLVNQAAQDMGKAGQDAPLYLAIPLLFPGEQTMLEMTVQPWDADREASADHDAPYLQATIRLATTRLGRVQATLIGTLSGALSCRLGAERPATLRLLRRSEAALTVSLGAQGWAAPKVSCTESTDWQPLWQGGAALAAPRARIDWKA